MLRAEPQITEAFRTGEGLGWHEHHDDVLLGVESFFRAGCVANLVPSWIPALEGVEAKLTAGARVADIGCGLGASSIILVQAFPRTTVIGSDYHDGSIDLARKRAVDAGVATRVGFEVASAQTFTGTGYDLVTTFDALHDMGDPVGAARPVREALAPDGTWLLVEPAAGDWVEDNLNPVGRLYYCSSAEVLDGSGSPPAGDHRFGTGRRALCGGAFRVADRDGVRWLVAGVIANSERRAVLGGCCLISA